MMGETHNAHVEKLFWIATSYESKPLKDFLTEIYEDELFNEVFKLNEKAEVDDPLEAIQDWNKLGFVAEVHYPVLSDFKYKDGENNPWTFSGGKGHCRIEYLYEENLDNLILSIEDKAAKLFNEFKAADLKKNPRK